MMENLEFLKHLKNKWDTPENRNNYKKLGLMEYYPQRSKGIEFNNGITLSIQGSFGHYCFPRQTLPYDKYTDMEFAILTENGFADVKDFIDTDKFDEYYDNTVYGYVPVADIEWLYQQLKKKYGLKGIK